MDIPLVENDLAQRGILEAGDLSKPNDAPRRAVMCFFPEVLEKAGGRIHALLHTHDKRPLYDVLWKGERVACFFPGLGAPAAVAALEEAIVMGCRDFVAVGGAGSLLPELTLGHAVIADRAVRDEGTSYHYLEPGRYIDADPQVNAAIEASLAAAEVPFVRGTTWTTDAIFRETRSRMERRVAEGCLTVEMEAAAFFAVGQYRGVRVGQLLYAGDTLTGDEWDSRDWTRAADLRTSLFEIALDAAVAVPADA
ncbi:nucleoside phosphorylase [Kribbella sp. NBC_01505]|uniref:nucleoside phosphorylase n=1 Tax=Kribbella sp. NBC_01505 TaxID=2903580 RepID=UPI00386E4678